MSEPLVLIERDTPGLAVLTLNRPQAMNALSVDLMAELAQQIDALGADPAVRVLLITGAGKAFCAGLDLKELGAGRNRLGGREPAGARHDPVAAMERFAGPIIVNVRRTHLDSTEVSLKDGVHLTFTWTRWQATRWWAGGGTAKS